MSAPYNDQVESNNEQGSPVKTEQAQRGSGFQIPLITIGAVILVLIGLSFLAYSLNSKDGRPIFPILPTVTQVSETPDYTPVILSFVELNADPSLYYGRRIQVSGTFTPVEPPVCPDYSGPLIRWSLVSEELQLNATGFENLLPFITPGTDMTVLGIWSAYKGAVGCGKQPPEETVWYLAVERILEPNPLVGTNGIILTVIPGEPLPTFSGIETPDFETPAVTPTIESTSADTQTPTLLPGSTFEFTPTPELTVLPGTPTTPGAIASPTASPGVGGTTALTPTIDLTATPEPTNGIPVTGTPPLPTSTPSTPGYPSQPTATPTTPSGYP